MGLKKKKLGSVIIKLHCVSKSAWGLDKNIDLPSLIPHPKDFKCHLADSKHLYFHQDCQLILKHINPHISEITEYFNKSMVCDIGFCGFQLILQSLYGD